MSDDLPKPIDLGLPMDDEDNADEGEVTEEDYEEVEDMNEELSDDSPYVEDGVEYDPATQAPKEAER